VWYFSNMELDPRTCYRALRTRDPRFDGRFFTGVASTGVYCRPVCPARTPKLANCRFFDRAAAAQEAGFRPCLRCRPEAAPGSPPWQGTSTTVARALRLIAAGAPNGGGVPELAARLGVGERHLRRLFDQYVGVSPLAVVQTQRILFAKQLLHETSMPMREVARAAGFASVRRFNDALRGTYGRAPRELRRERGDAAVQPGALSLVQSFRPPYDWDALLGFLAARAIPGVETVADGVYRRSVQLHRGAGLLEVRRAPHGHALEVQLHGTLAAGELLPLVARLRNLFDLCADPLPIASHFAADPALRRLVRRRPGLRVPGAWDGFELAVRAVLGQQVSVRAARTLAGRLAAQYGAALAPEAAPLERLFPAAAQLAEADLGRIGLTRARAATLRALALVVARGDMLLDPTGDPEATRAALLQIRGIGAWTAEYIALRALRDPDAFPAADLGLRQSYARQASARPGAPARAASPSLLTRAAEAWRPWRAYAAIHLWTEGGTT
jgi:AraC family transcriptional regulator, regulatory protein of adaptative response / DNA-3-methyladenine glycosylase II